MTPGKHSPEYQRFIMGNYNPTLEGVLNTTLTTNHWPDLAQTKLEPSVTAPPPYTPLQMPTSQVLYFDRLDSRQKSFLISERFRDAADADPKLDDLLSGFRFRKA